MSQSVRFYLRSLGEKQTTPAQRMQLNPSHPIVKGLHGIHKSNPDKARVVATQMVNNAFVAAGLIDDAREMLYDMNDVMSLALGLTPPARAAKLHPKTEADDEEELEQMAK